MNKIIPLSLIIMSCVTSLKAISAPNLHVFSSNQPAMASDVNDNFNYLDTSLVSLQNEVTTLDTDVSGFTHSISNLNSSVSALDTDVSGLSSSVASVNSSVSALGTDVSGLTTSVSSVNSSVSALSADVSSLTTSVSSVNSTVSGLDTDVSSLSTSVTALETDVLTLSTSVSNMDLAISTLDTDVLGLSTSVSSVSSSVSTIAANLSERLDNLENPGDIGLPYVLTLLISNLNIAQCELTPSSQIWTVNGYPLVSKTDYITTSAINRYELTFPTHNAATPESEEVYLYRNNTIDGKTPFIPNIEVEIQAFSSGVTLVPAQITGISQSQNTSQTTFKNHWGVKLALALDSSKPNEITVVNFPIYTEENSFTDEKLFFMHIVKRCISVKELN